MNKSLTGLLAATAISVSLLSATGIQGANATPSPSPAPIVKVQPAHQSANLNSTLVSARINVRNVARGSIFDRVENARSFQEVYTILKKDGYSVDNSLSTANTIMFTKVAGTARIMYPVSRTPQAATPAPGRVAAQASVGFKWSKGPYVKATLNQWQSIVKYGIAGASGLCSLASGIGAVGCVSLATVAVTYISSHNIPAGGACIAVAPLLINNPARAIWIENC